MHPLEKFSIRLRHTYLGERANWLWCVLRPIYDFAVKTSAKSGLERIINGTDPLRVAPEFRQITEVYEPDVWARVMSAVTPGSVVLDVGAYVGLYTIALAQRTGPTGRVYSFEPDPQNCAVLRKHVELNNVSDRVEVHQLAVGDKDGFVPFSAGRDSQSFVGASSSVPETVRMTRLDTILPRDGIDVLKVDVEGFEENVLKGAEVLLSDNDRKPGTVFIEVHPYNWRLCGTTSDSLINRLTKSGYDVLDLKSQSVSTIDWYGEIIAIDRNVRRH
jgi:FkbM family methyltransferase